MILVLIAVVLLTLFLTKKKSIPPEHLPQIAQPVITKKAMKANLKRSRELFDCVERRLLTLTNPKAIAHKETIRTQIQENIESLEQSLKAPRVALGRKYHCYACGCDYRDPHNVRRCPNCGKIRFRSW